MQAGGPSHDAAAGLDNLYGLGYKAVKWDVQVYKRELPNGPIEQEVGELNQDNRLRMDIAFLVGWLKQARAGEAYPQGEPVIGEADGPPLRFRCVGGVVLVFSLLEKPPRLVVLRFARAASTFPKTADCALAAQRLEEYKKRQES